MNKTKKRVKWIKENKDQLAASTTPLEGSTHNAYYNRGMSSGGWGWWVRAFDKAGCPEIAQSMPYWDGPAPTPSIAINKGVAIYISANAPSSII